MFHNIQSHIFRLGSSQIKMMSVSFQLCKPENMALDIMKHFNLAQYFTCICGASLDRSRTSKSAVISYLLNQCGQKNNLIMVGDTSYDVLGASAHGIDTVGVSWGYGHVDDMEAAGAVDIAHSMDELYEILSK